MTELTTPLLETCKPKLNEILKENKLRQQRYAEKLEKLVFVDFSDEVIKGDVDFLIKKLKEISVTNTGLFIKIDIKETSVLLTIKKLAQIWSRLTANDEYLVKNIFFRKSWFAFVNKQIMKLTEKLSEDSGIPIMNNDRDLTAEGIFSSLLEIHIWW